MVAAAVALPESPPVAARMWATPVVRAAIGTVWAIDTAPGTELVKTATSVAAAVAKTAMPTATGASAMGAAAEDEQAEAGRLDDREEAADHAGADGPRKGVEAGGRPA